MELLARLEARQADRLDEFVGLERRLAIAEEEIVDRDLARAVLRAQTRSIASSANRHGKVSPIGEAVPRLPPKVPRLRIWREPSRRIMAAKDGNARSIARQRLGISGGGAELDGIGAVDDALQFGHEGGRNDQRQALAVLADAQAEIGAAGQQRRVGIGGARLGQCGERARRQESLIALGVSLGRRQRRQRRRRRRRGRGQPVGRAAGRALDRVDDRPIAGATAEIAGQRLVDRLHRSRARRPCRNAVMAMMKPGVQKPHCVPSVSTIACCTGCSGPSGAASPSTVTSAAPSSWGTIIRQLLTAS